MNAENCVIFFFMLNGYLSFLFKSVPVLMGNKSAGHTLRQGVLAAKNALA
jgi:hypothetical protein